MTLILCALLACCVTTPPVAKCDGNSCDLECAPVLMSWGEFLSRHLDTLWYSDYHNGDSVRVWVDHPRFTPGLWEYRCEVDTLSGLWVYGERWVNLPCPDASNQNRQDGYVIGATVTACAAFHGEFVKDSTWIASSSVIDTTCVWERAQEYEYFDTYCMDRDYKRFGGVEWNWHQPCDEEVRLFREVKR